jgi:hypothetical protein
MEEDMAIARATTPSLRTTRAVHVGMLIVTCLLLRSPIAGAATGCPGAIVYEAGSSSSLDVGSTGSFHDVPVIGWALRMGVSGCAGSTVGSCGQCNITGLVTNAGGSNRRCSNDTSIKCTSNTLCTPGGGTCQFFFGSMLPLAAGGVTTCVVNQFNGPISGTADIPTGSATTIANLTSRVYNGLAIDNPCPRCVGDTTLNDGGITVGACDGGVRVGLACDGNGTVANRPDFGTTSLDCPLAAGGLIATLPIDLSSATNAVTKTVSATSPGCSGAPGERCLCSTCNNANAEPCQSNASCPDPAGPIGPICGGNRCLGGTNAGAACTNVTECPGGGQCNKPGEPIKASACLDDTATPGVLDCNDTAPVDGEGECGKGPVTNTCSVASGHGQRGCTNDGDCGGGAGSCESTNRRCFLTGGFTGNAIGTNTLIAVGMADVPVNDTSHPTLGAVFCVGPTGAAAVNNVAGLPGPGRVTIRGTAKGLP